MSRPLLADDDTARRRQCARPGRSGEVETETEYNEARNPYGARYARRAREREPGKNCQLCLPVRSTEVVRTSRQGIDDRGSTLEGPLMAGCCLTTVYRRYRPRLRKNAFAFFAVGQLAQFEASDCVAVVHMCTNRMVAAGPVGNSLPTMKNAEFSHGLDPMRSPRIVKTGPSIFPSCRAAGPRLEPVLAIRACQKR
jgi:hypothetical protein